MAGLACAVRLHAAGIPCQVLEASDGVGGRVRTDQVDGFLLDRGFQVYLDAYPETGKLLDLDALELGAFEPGALVYDGHGLHRLMDVFRRPRAILGGARAPIGSLTDKLRVPVLRQKILGRSNEAIWKRPATTTEAYLQESGFSAKMIDGFFRAFYGGIFLERELQTSSQMFEFTFKLFTQGSATLPAKGMGAIPKQLAQRLPAETIRLNTRVAQVSPNGVELTDGTRLTGRAVVVATEVDQAMQLLPAFKPENSKWRAVSNVYFRAPRSPLNEGIIALNGSDRGLVNNVCVPSDVAPGYAPEGAALISVSVLGTHPEGDLHQKVREELSGWFGPQVHEWTHLRTDHIPKGLPEQKPTQARTPLSPPLQRDGVWICGDHTASASIEGAVVSGLGVAREIIDPAPRFPVKPKTPN
jgi:phytoene dehydrogenase-like protein